MIDNRQDYTVDTPPGFSVNIEHVGLLQYEIHITDADGYDWRAKAELAYGRNEITVPDAPTVEVRDLLFRVVTSLTHQNMQLLLNDHAKSNGWTHSSEPTDVDYKATDDTLNKFATDLASRQEDLPPEFQKVLDDNFWDLVATGKDKDSE